MSDIPSKSGRKLKPLNSESASTPAPKPLDASSKKSNLPHKQKMTERANPKSISSQVEGVAALLGGKAAPTIGAENENASERRTVNQETSPTSDAASVGSDPAIQPTRSDTSSQEFATTDAGTKRLPDEYGPKELAEFLGIEPKKLYEQLRITTQEGETLSFGELKDRVKAQETATRAQVEREATLDRREAEQLETLQLIDSVGASVIQQFPQAAAMLSDYGKKVRSRERERALKAMPELADQAHRAQFQDDIAEHLAPYGFRKSQINIMDHRILLALRDAIKTKKQLAKLLEFEPTATPPKVHRPQGKQPRASRTQKAIATAQRSGRKSDAVAAVSSLINGGR